MNRSDRRRAATGIALVTALLGTAATAVAWRGADREPTTDSLHLRRAGTVVSVDSGRVRQTTRAGEPLGSGPSCERAAVAAGTLVCLRGLPGPMSSEVRVYRAGDSSPRVTLPVWGQPSRARVSPSGRLVAWTVFRTGDSYVQQGRFSTTAGIYDLETGAHHGSLEDFTPVVDGKPYRKDDRNFWGVTFARDDRTFYVTMASRGQTWLMRGDLGTRRLTAVRQNVECPSLSPDGTRIAYKKRVGDRWRLHVLHLGSGEDVPLAETADIDDQAAWLDDRTVAYAKPSGGGPHVFTVPADGSGTPREAFRGSSPTPTTGPERPSAGGRSTPVHTPATRA
ncbi:TolB family protein [Streptomyces sp. NPDC018031]|uniref:TolB family protein n=1 Tax=Streptomyces sp. NPDC018031 TaxID=3365033 RepID=UPI0037AD8C16